MTTAFLPFSRGFIVTTVWTRTTRKTRSASTSITTRLTKRRIGSTSTTTTISSSPRPLFTTAAPTARQDILREKLESLGVNATSLHEAHEAFLRDPTQGYDPAFGKSAIKAYRSFLHLSTRKQKQQQQPNIQQQQKQEEGQQQQTQGEEQQQEQQEDNIQLQLQLQSHAGTCARQVHFLIKRHVAAQADWIRHLDQSKIATTTFPLILILDNVRSAMNVGSLFRTADATACRSLWTIGITPHPHGNGSDKLQKSALGAQWTVPHQHFSTLPTPRVLHEHLRHSHLYNNYTIIGMETTNQSRLYTALNYADMVASSSLSSSSDNRNINITTNSNTNHHDDNDEKGGGGIAIVLGNEVTGLDPETLSVCDYVVEIPMFGTKNSLNIAACAPILLYEIIRQLKEADTTTTVTDSAGGTANVHTASNSQHQPEEEGTV